MLRKPLLLAAELASMKAICSECRNPKGTVRHAGVVVGSYGESIYCSPGMSVLRAAVRVVDVATLKILRED